MSTAELNKIKLNLIAWIHQLSDATVISFIEGIKNSRSQKNEWNELSAQQQKIILSGLKDARSGKVISSDEFWKKLKDA